MPRSASVGGDSVSAWSVVGPPSGSSQPGGGAGADWTGQPLAAGPADHARHSEEVCERWARLVRSAQKIRKWQRYFHETGERLQDFPKAIRDRVARSYPKQ